MTSSAMSMRYGAPFSEMRTRNVSDVRTVASDLRAAHRDLRDVESQVSFS